MTALWIALAGLAGVGLTAFGAWWSVRHKSSGKVATTEAETLWAESQAIRRELRDEANNLRNRVTALEDETRKCHADAAQLRAKVAILERQVGLGQ